MPVPATTASPKKQRDAQAQARRERVVGLISAADAAVRLGVQPPVVGRWARAGRLGQVVQGPYDRLYVHPAVVDALAQRLAAERETHAAAEGLPTLRQVATQLGVSVWVIERLTHRLHLQPLTGPRAWRYFNADHVDQLRKALAARSVDGLVNVLTAAQLVGLSRFTLLDYAQRGVLPTAARGRSNAPYFKLEDVTALIARRAAARAVPAGHVTQREACARLGVTRQRLSQLVKRGHLHPILALNGHRRFRLSELDAYRARNPRPVPCQGTTTKGRTMAHASGALAC